MADDARAGRMAVRFSEEDRAWLTENAEDEGVEPATLVRLIINRLRRGRPLLMSMVGTQMSRPTPTVEPTPNASSEVFDALAADAADEVLRARLGELDNGADVVQLHDTEDQGAAIPLRRLPRQQYNPGRN